MMRKAIFIGSIGVVAETSDLQRQAYNHALREAGLNWFWDRDTYASLLTLNGGQDRLRLLRNATQNDLSDRAIEQIHARKTELACERIRKEGVSLRPGVSALLQLALDSGWKIGWVTTTYQPNIDAIIEATSDALPIDNFDIVTMREHVSKGKPDPEVYQFAMAELRVTANSCIAFEDTMLSSLAPKRAGIPTVLVPGDLTAGQDSFGADYAFKNFLDERGDLRKEIVSLIAGDQSKGVMNAA